MPFPIFFLDFPWQHGYAKQQLFSFFLISSSSLSLSSSSSAYSESYEKLESSSFSSFFSFPSSILKSLSLSYSLYSHPNFHYSHECSHDVTFRLASKSNITSCDYFKPLFLKFAQETNFVKWSTLHYFKRASLISIYNHRYTRNVIEFTCKVGMRTTLTKRYGTTWYTTYYCSNSSTLLLSTIKLWAGVYYR